MEAHIDDLGTSIAFRALHFSNFVDPSLPIEYDDLLLNCTGAPIPEPNKFVGQLSVMIAGATCSIVGRQ
jgi:hypothetical protein